MNCSLFSVFRADPEQAARLRVPFGARGPRMLTSARWTSLRSRGRGGGEGLPLWSSIYRRSQRKPSCRDSLPGRGLAFRILQMLQPPSYPPSWRRGHRAFGSPGCVAVRALRVAVEHERSPPRSCSPIISAANLRTLQCSGNSVLRIEWWVAEPRVFSPAAPRPHFSSCVYEPLAFSPAAACCGTALWHRCLCSCRKVFSVANFW